MYKKLIRLKVELNYKLTEKERAKYLLFIATKKQAIEFLREEKELKKW